MLQCPECGTTADEHDYRRYLCSREGQPLICWECLWKQSKQVTIERQKRERDQQRHADRRTARQRSRARA